MTAMAAPDPLAQIFCKVGTAHHAAFAATKGDDPHWPEWYAAYLVGPLNQLLGTEVPAQTSSTPRKQTS